MFAINPSQVRRMRAATGACISQEWGTAGKDAGVKKVFTPIFRKHLVLKPSPLAQRQEWSGRGLGSPQERVEMDSSRFSRGGRGSSPLTRNQTFSAMLVAWSPTRSMFLAMNSRCVQPVMLRASSIM